MESFNWMHIIGKHCSHYLVTQYTRWFSVRKIIAVLYPTITLSCPTRWFRN